MMKKHSFAIRVYYEDTDAGGIVYYANYLKFAERARTELLRDANIHQSDLAKQEGVYFVVRKVAMELFKPAKLDDLLTIKTVIKQIKGASIVMHQTIMREQVALADIEVKIASINNRMKPSRIPLAAYEALSIEI